MPDSKQTSAMVQQVRDGSSLFKASVREVTLQLQINVPERARLFARTFEYYAALLSKIQPFLEVLERKVGESERLEEELAVQAKLNNAIRQAERTNLQELAGATWAVTVDNLWARVVSDADLNEKCRSETQRADKAEATSRSTQSELDATREKVTELEGLLAEAKRDAESKLAKQRQEWETKVAEAESGRREAEEVLRSERARQAEEAKAMAAELVKEANAARDEVKKTLERERDALKAATVGKSTAESALATEKATSSARLSLATESVAALRQAATLLSESEPDAVNPASIPKDDTPSASSVVALSGCVKAGVMAMRGTVAQLRRRDEDATEGTKLLEDKADVATEEADQLRAAVASLEERLSATRVTTTCAEVQTSGCANGLDTRGTQTWASKWEEDKAEGRQPEQEPLQIAKPGEKKPGHEPLALFVLSYLQKRFGLLRPNAEWEVGRLRQQLGRVLDVFVQKSSSMFDADAAPLDGL